MYLKSREEDIQFSFIGSEHHYCNHLPIGIYFPQFHNIHQSQIDIYYLSISGLLYLYGIRLVMELTIEANIENRAQQTSTIALTFTELFQQ